MKLNSRILLWRFLVTCIYGRPVRRQHGLEAGSGGLGTMRRSVRSIGASLAGHSLLSLSRLLLLQRIPAGCADLRRSAILIDTRLTKGARLTR